jgi:hypothetical protein
MASLHAEEKIARDRLQRETARLAAQARRRSAKVKPTVSAADVQTLMDSMSNEGRAVVTAMASNKLVRRTLPWMTR